MDQGLPIDDEKDFLTEAVFAGVHLYQTTQTAQTQGHAAQHLATKEVWDAASPEFKSSLEPLISGAEGVQALLSLPTWFSSLLEQIQALPRQQQGQHIGVIVTKPPETVLIIVPSADTGRWALFDSHSRPQLGIHGSYLVTATSHEPITARLVDLFPGLPSEGNDDAVSIWHMMYNTVEATPFVRKCV